MSGRRVAHTIAGIVAAVLVVLITVLTVQALDQNARTARLRSAGVPVRVRVVRCVGLASGTGITVAGYRCLGSYAFEGRRHVAVIGGSSALHSRGWVLPALADPGDPGVLATPASVARGFIWSALIAPAVLLTLVVTAAATWLRRTRRSRRG